MPLAMFPFFLKLLGVWHSVKEFIVNNWKWVVPLVSAIILAIMCVNWYHGKIKESYNKGVAFEQSVYEAKIKAEDENNRKFEKTLQDIINKYGSDVAKQAAQRVIQENQYKEKITTIVKNNPVYQTCKIDQAVIDYRNQIRSLGPKGD